MTWKEEIKKKDKPIYQQPDKMKFIGPIYNPNKSRLNDIYGHQTAFQRILNKGNKRRNGLRMHELEKLLTYAEKINDTAPKQLAWIKAELKKHK